MINVNNIEILCCVHRLFIAGLHTKHLTYFRYKNRTKVIWNAFIIYHKQAFHNTVVPWWSLQGKYDIRNKTHTLYTLQYTLCIDIKLIIILSHIKNQWQWKNSIAYAFGRGWWDMVMEWKDPISGIRNMEIYWHLYGNKISSLYTILIIQLCVYCRPMNWWMTVHDSF